jgi:rare lipoprotein A
MRWLLLGLLATLLTVGSLGVGAREADASAYESWASYYGPGLYGNYTASGDVLDYYDWTAAHKTLPLGTTITICYYGSCAYDVVITDRGPYVWGRDLDMTEYVANSIGFPGLGPVDWWVSGYDPSFYYYRQY